MIGVMANPSEGEVVREFFELFKTPWEFFRRNRRYEVLLCAGDVPIEAAAELVLVYGGRKTNWDDERKIRIGDQLRRSGMLLFQENRIPIYGNAVTFTQNGKGLLTREDSGESAAFLERSEGSVFVRIGYDLFGEVRTLLSEGQPAAQAHLPTLELHIAFLRQLITGCGISLVEIPPIPQGYRFIACLTHDVDHPSLRRHRADHTTFGFLSRAVFGSLRNLVRGRISLRGLITNWGAAWKLPLVHLGLAEDFWSGFDDRYLEVEENLTSTFFVIPFKNNAGKGFQGKAPRRRAARYGARDIAGSVRKLMTAGREIGLHGIDAWCDSAKGREELEEIRRLTGMPEIGVRMHWLYYSRQSAALLEKAGVDYDSTVGYNETVGYRAGTTQAYKPLEASRLLELPMHVMDTALFYPGHLGLSQREAMPLLGRMIADAGRFGGCLTINWHDRSLSPERLWGQCYRDLLQELKSQGVWFATAGQAVSWFRKRRSAGFEMGCMESGVAGAKLSADHDDLPGLRLRLHRGRTSINMAAQESDNHQDLPIDEDIAVHVPAEVKR